MPQGKRGSEIDALAVEYSNQVLDQEADKQGVPRSFARKIAGIESADRADVITGGRRSSAGAIGKMQLMPATAKGLGVDPYNIDQNIAGGVKYLGQQLKSFGGDQRLAAAAYNSGPGNVRKYNGVPPFAETQKYAANFGGGEESEIDKLAREFSGQTTAPAKPSRPTAQPLRAPNTTSPFSFDAPTGFQSAVAETAARSGVSPEAQAQINKQNQAYNTYSQKGLGGRLREDATVAAARAGEWGQNVGQRVIGTGLGLAKGATNPQLGFAPVDIRTAAGKAGQEATAQRLAEREAAAPDPASKIRRGLVQGALQAPVYAAAVEAGGLPALAGLNVAQEDWQDPKRSAFRAIANTAIPLAGGKLGQMAVAPLARGLAPGANAATRYAGEAVGGGATNVAQTAAEQKIFDGRVDPRELASQAVIGGLLSPAMARQGVRGQVRADQANLKSVGRGATPEAAAILEAPEVAAAETGPGPAPFPVKRPLNRTFARQETAPLSPVLPAPGPKRRVVGPAQRQRTTDPLTEPLTEPLNPNAPETTAMPAVANAPETSQIPQEAAPPVNPRNRTITAAKQNADAAAAKFQESFDQGDYAGAERSLRQQQQYLKDIKSIIGKPKTPGDSVQRSRLEGEIGAIGQRIGEVRKARRGIVSQENRPTADLPVNDVAETTPMPRVTVPETRRVTAEADAPTREIVSPVPDAPRVEEVKAPALQEPSISEPRRVRINDQDVDLSPEQAARWDESAAKYQQDRANIQRSLDQGIIDKQQAGERMRGLGMRESAERREIAQSFTPKERAAQAKKEASNYRGKEVEVDGRKGKVAGMSFGKVRVKLEDGSVISVDQDKIGAPKTVESTEAATEPPQIERPAPLARIADQPPVLRESRPTQKANAPETAALRPKTRVPEVTAENIGALERRYENASRIINERPDTVTGDLRNYRRELGAVIGEYRRANLSPEQQELRGAPRPSPRQLRRQGEIDAEAGRVAREYFRNAKAPETGPVTETPETASKIPQVERAQVLDSSEQASSTKTAKIAPLESQPVENRPVNRVDDLAAMRAKVARMSASEVDRALTDAEAARNEDIANPIMGGRTRLLGNEYRKALNERRSSLVSKKELPAKRPMSSNESLGMKWSRDPEFRQDANAFNEEFGRYPADVAELRRGRPRTEPIATIQHERFGEVEVTGKAPGGKLIVEDADGQSHTIQNPRTKGNQQATFVKKPLTEELPMNVAEQVGVLPESAVDPNDPPFVAAAKRRLRETATGKRANAGQALLDQAIVTGYKVYKAGMDFSTWAKAVIQEAGASVRPRLREAWDALRADSETALDQAKEAQTERLGELDESIAGKRGRLDEITGARKSLDTEAEMMKAAGKDAGELSSLQEGYRKDEAKMGARVENAAAERRGILRSRQGLEEGKEFGRTQQETVAAKGERIGELDAKRTALETERRAIQTDQAKLEAAGKAIPEALKTSLEKNTSDLRQVRKDLARNRAIVEPPRSMSTEKGSGNDKGYYLDKAEGTDKAPVLYIQDDLWGRAPRLNSGAVGLSFSEINLNQIIKSLGPDKRYSKITSEEQAQLLNQIQEAKAVADAKGLTGLAIAKKSTFSDPEQKLAKHETFHVGQQEALRVVGDESQDVYALHDPQWAKDHPILKEIIKTPHGSSISTNYGGKLDPNMLAVELPAIISGGQIGEFKGQLSEGQAIDYMYDYLDHIYDYRGKAAFEEIAKRARLDARTEGYFKTIREERGDAAGLEELGGNLAGIRETQGSGAEQGTDSRASDAANARKNEASGARLNVPPPQAPATPPQQPPSVPAGLARQRAIAQAKKVAATPGKPPVAATPKVAPQAKPATPGQAPKTAATPKAPQTAQEYFDEQMKKSPFNVAGQRVKDLANEEARTALKKAADRVVRGKMNPNQEKAVISAADDLMMAGRLGDQDGIKKGRDSLLRAMRNTDQQGALKRGALALARAPGQAARAAQSVVYGGDISFPLRQAAPLSLNPFNALKTYQAIKDSYNSFGREESGNFSVLPGSKGAEAVRKQLEAHPRYDLGKQAGLELNLYGDQEEVYRDAGWSQKVPLLKTWMKRTEAANVAFLDSMRLSVFDKYANAIEKNTKLSQKQQELAMKSAAEVVNTMTGRTDLGEGKIKEFADFTNGIFAAPKLLVSRAKLLDPTAIPREWKKNPDVAKQMLKDAVGVVGPWTAILTAAAAAGAKVGWNPEDQDFGKIVVDDTAIDMTAGMTPIMKVAYAWSKVGAKVGNEMADPSEENTKERQRAQRDAIFRTARFTRSKLGPATSYLADLLWYGEDFEKNKMTMRSTINPMDPNFAPYRLAAPLGVTGAVKDIREEGSSVGKVAATSALEFFGASAYNKKARGEKLDRKSKFIQESETQGIDFRDLRPEKGEPDQVFKARTGKANSWLTQYGEQLVNSPDYRAATAEQKERALRSLKARVMTEAKQKAPNMGNFNPSSIIRSIRQSERSRRRNRSDLIWAPPED